MSLECPCQFNLFAIKVLPKEPTDQTQGRRFSLLFLKNMPPQSDPKRKASEQPVAPHRATKRVKVSEARTILSQSTDKALNQTGELDVPAYVKAREYEIQALENSMSGSKKALSTRAFQQVPRDLRRRTASHNVKKVTKRLRARAAKEVSAPEVPDSCSMANVIKMKDDNTPTKTRRPTPQQRLRSENLRRIQTIKKFKAKKAESDAAKSTEHGATKSGAAEGASESIPVKPKPPKLKQNALQEPEKPPVKFKKRQVHKTWLPTHMFHAKRAHMPLPKQPLWRFAVPLTPTEKSYRPTHRAGWMRGCVAWDTSYMSTIALEGVELSLLGLLRCVGIEEKHLTGKAGQKWRRGTRHWKGWIRERDTPQNWVAPAQIVWCIHAEDDSERPFDKTQTKKKGEKRRMFLRVHPAAFFQVWEELLKVGKMQRPQVAVEDLRFELGSIELLGPGSTEALVAALRPFAVNDAITESNHPSDQAWASLATLNNPASLPAQAVLALDVSDPRLHHPPKTMKPPETLGEDYLLQLLAHWPPDDMQISPTIFSREARLAAARQLPSQKSINRRKSEALPRCVPEHAPDDPRIPTLVLASRCENTKTRGQGRWTVILPWKCVSPVWRSLMYYPLSTGGNPRFGGLDETRQIAFEQGVPWFPGDFPGTKGGWEWELQERQKAREEWARKPKGRRIEWESVDLGNGRKGEIGIGWGCDWDRLFGPFAPGDSKSKVNETGLAGGSGDSIAQNAVNDGLDKNEGKNEDQTKDSSAPSDLQPNSQHSQVDISNNTNQAPDHDPKEPRKPASLSIRQIPIHLLPSLLPSPSPPQSLITITLTLLHRGVPTRCARLYRLPTSNTALCAQWLLQASPPSKGPTTPQENPTNPATDKNLHPSRQGLPLTSPPNPRSRHSIPKPGEKDYPLVPDEEDLIGFVTTGNFNLGEGRGFGIGCMVAEKVWGELKGGSGEGGLCIVRDAGTAIGRVARWEVA